MSGRMEMDNKREKWIEEKLTSCSQIIRDYMTSICQPIKTSATRKAYLGYLLDYENFVEDLGIDMIDAKPMHIDKYRSNLIKKGNGNSIINTKLSAVDSFYEFLKSNEFITSNPCDKIKKLRINEKSTVVSMTDKEVDLLKSNIKTRESRKVAKWKNRDVCIVQLGCSTGLRVSAIVNIDIKDIDFDKKEVSVIEKGNNPRTILLGDRTINMIRTWMGDREKIMDGEKYTDALFISQKKNRISVRAVEEMIEKNSNNIGKHITPHKMRSTCGMRLYEKKHDIYLVQQQLGHKNIKNTQIYAKASKAMLREAANILD